MADTTRTSLSEIAMTSSPEEQWAVKREFQLRWRRYRQHRVDNG